jgi:mitochondrial fission protein ELM1
MQAASSLVIWVVSENNAGTINQAMGVAERLTSRPVVKTVTKQRRWQRWLRPFRQDPTEVEPDIIISCGMVSERFVSAMKRAFGGRPLAVHLQYPGKKDDCFDLVFVSTHDWAIELEAMSRVHQMLGVPNRLRGADLAARRTTARARWAPDDLRVLAMLVGGPNQAFKFDQEAVDRLKSAAETALEQGYVVLATVSRRSPPGVASSLRAIGHPRFILWNSQGENPYLDYVAAADALLVTQDSISMAGDAIVSGKAVNVFALPVTDEARAHKFLRFHADLEAQGFSRPFAGKIEQWDYDTPDETGRVASIVDRVYRQRLKSPPAPHP